MKKVLWIGTAGAAGAILRTGIGQAMLGESGFPLATFTVNMIGTFLLCLLVTGAFRMLSAHGDLQDAVSVGFLGSFTTFSALSIETILLVENGQLLLAAVYVGLSIIGGILTGLLGFSLWRKLVGA